MKRLITFGLAIVLILTSFAPLKADAANNWATFSTIEKDGVTYWQAKRDNKIIYEAKANKQTKYVTASKGLKIRKTPTTKAKNKYTTYAYRKEVKVLGISKGWALIEAKDGEKYFCSNKYLSTKKPSSVKTKMVYTAKTFKRMGVIKWNGWKWTWYSQKVLPGGGLKIPGRHVDKNNYVCDKNGYIVLSSSSLKKGTVIKTPFGKKGKVYDTGCARGVVDVYTNF